MDVNRCALCLFCEEVSNDYIRCNNADMAKDFDGEKVYIEQGYFDLPLTIREKTACFWFVQNR